MHIQSTHVRCCAAGGVLKSVSDSVVAVSIPQGAHHLDLMFSHPSDSASLRASRRLEMRNVRQWIRQKAAAVRNSGGALQVRVLERRLGLVTAASTVQA